MWTDVSWCTNRAMEVTAWSESLHLKLCIGSWVNETSSYEFYVYGSLYRWSILLIVQRDATQSSLFIILHVHFYMFRVSTTPIIRSTQNCNYSLRYCTATSLQRGQSDDGCGWHPKHVEWTCRIISTLLCVASRWKIIDIDQRWTEIWT